MSAHRPKRFKKIIIGAAMTGVAGLLGVAAAANAAEGDVGTWVLDATVPSASTSAQSVSIFWVNSNSEVANICVPWKPGETKAINMTGVLGRDANALSYSTPNCSDQALSLRQFKAPNNGGESVSITLD